MQDLEKTIEDLTERDDSSLVPVLYEVIQKYGSETVRDLKLNDWRCQFERGLSAGYFLCFMGELEKGLRFIDAAVEMRKGHNEPYMMKRSSALEIIVGALKGMQADLGTISKYESEFKKAKKTEKETPGKLKREIIHTEASIECLTGDLDESSARCRHYQGECYQKLGEYQKAIDYFRMAIKDGVETRRDEESFVKSKISIVDCFLELKDRKSALEEFMGLLTTLAPQDLKFGESLPREIFNYFHRIHPYFEKIGINDTLDSMAKYAEGRLNIVLSQKSSHGDKRDNVESEMADLARMLAAYHAGRGEYQKASDMFDSIRGKLKYPNWLSKMEQAEYAIKSGNNKRALELIKDEDKPRLEYSEDKFKLANLYLQLNDVNSALLKLDEYCEYHKRGYGGTYGTLYETRRMQIEILRKLIGKDYVQKVRKYSKGKEGFKEETMKFLPLEKRAEKSD